MRVRKRRATFVISQKRGWNIYHFGKLQCLILSRSTYGGCRDKPYLVTFASTLFKRPPQVPFRMDFLLYASLILCMISAPPFPPHAFILIALSCRSTKNLRSSLILWSCETYSKTNESLKSAWAVPESQDRSSRYVRKLDVSSPSKELERSFPFRKFHCTLHGAEIVAHTQ